MKTLLTLIILIPSLSWGEKKTFTTEELFGDSEKLLTFEDAKELENQEKEYEKKYRDWQIKHYANVGECFIDNLKDGIGDLGSKALMQSCYDYEYNKNRPPEKP